MTPTLSPILTPADRESLMRLAKDGVLRPGTYGRTCAGVWYECCLPESGIMWESWQVAGIDGQAFLRIDE